MLDTMREQWNYAIMDFEQARAQLDAAESDLYAWQQTAAQDARDYAEWQEQFSRVNAIKSTIDRLAEIARAFSDGWSTVRETFGLSGRRGIAGALGVGPVAVPVIAGMSVSAFLILVGKISAIAAGVAAFISYLATKNEFASYIPTRASELVAQGVDPVRASEIAQREASTAAQSSTGYTFTTELRKMLMWTAAGIAAVFVVPKLLDRR